jgi:mannose-6-phosphate isomerase-like protein (cupin superfamily)
MKQITLALLAAAIMLGSAGTADIYSAKDLEAMKVKLAEAHPAFKSQSLKNYGNHYTMLAYREATGSAELHEHETDILMVAEGGASIIIGGKLIDQHTEKPGEIRAKSIAGGEKHAFGAGAVVHIPAGVPHQVVLGKGETVSYFVVKVLDK